jgi:hypothetical protein
MTNETALTDDEFAALAAIDGKPAQAELPPEIKKRLSDMCLVERRAWPNGPLWRTAAGNRRVRDGK